MKMNVTVILAACLLGIAPSAHAKSNQSNGSHIVSLEAAIVRTLNEAPEIRAGAEMFSAAATNAWQARVRPNPEFEFELEDFGGDGAFAGTDAAEYTYSLSQQIEIGGKRNARKAVAASGISVARNKQAVDRLDLIQRVQVAYIQVQAAKVTFDTATGAARGASEIAEIVGKRVDRARDPVAARQRAILEALDMQMNADQAGWRLNAAKQQLASLWNDPERDFEVDAAKFYRVSAAHQPRNENQPPDLALLVASQAQADAAADLARARAWQDPTVGVGVRHFNQSGDVAGLVSLSIPLAVWDSNRAGIARANAELRAVEWNVARAERDYEIGVSALTQSLDGARAEARIIHSKLIPTAKQALSATRDGYEKGAFTYIDIADAQRSLRELRSREIEALTRFHLASAAWDRLTARFSETLPGEEVAQ